jgi:hypothetical protein
MNNGKGVEMKNILVLLVVISLLIPISVKAQSTLALQEKCAEGAKKIVSETGGCLPVDAGKDYLMFCDYKSHYNKKLDKCFVRFDFKTVWKDNAPEPFKGRTYEAVQIIDVFGHEMIAYYDATLNINEVGGRRCNSRTEFENLIKPYMEE